MYFTHACSVRINTVKYFRRKSYTDLQPPILASKTFEYTTCTEVRLLYCHILQPLSIIKQSELCQELSETPLSEKNSCWVFSCIPYWVTAECAPEVLVYRICECMEKIVRANSGVAQSTGITSQNAMTASSFLSSPSISPNETCLYWKQLLALLLHFMPATSIMHDSAWCLFSM